MGTAFLCPGKSCFSASVSQSSSRGWEVLGSCSAGVQQLPKLVVASQATVRQRSDSPVQTGLAGLPHDGGRLPMAGKSLPWCFWAAELFQAAASAGQLLCGSHFHFNHQLPPPHLLFDYLGSGLWRWVGISCVPCAQSVFG